MGRPILKMAHTTANCHTRYGLQCFAEDDGRVTGYCFSCGQYISNPLGKNTTVADLEAEGKIPPPKTEAEIKAEMAEISGYQCLDITQKKLRAQYLDEFGIKVGVSESDGKTPETVYYPYRKNGKLTGYKVKLLPKDNKPKMIWSIGETKDVEPFGWQEAVEKGAKKLLIVEGEDDAVAAQSIIQRHTKDEWREYTPAIISLPHGAGNAGETLSKWKKQIDQNWKEVVLCFDMDKAGQEAIEKALLVLPNAVVADLPSKDLNQSIIDGHQKAAFNAITFNAQKKKNSRLVFGDDLHVEAKEQARYGELTWPWEHLNETTRGIRLGETIYIGAG